MKIVLVLLVIFFSFSLQATTNLVADDDFVKTLLIGIWFISSILLIFVFLPLYLVKRKKLFAILTDIGLISLIIFMLNGVLKLGSVSRNEVITDSANHLNVGGMNPQFWIFLVLSVILTLAMLFFVWFQIKNHRNRIKND